MERRQRNSSPTADEFGAERESSPEPGRGNPEAIATTSSASSSSRPKSEVEAQPEMHSIESAPSSQSSGREEAQQAIIVTGKQIVLTQDSYLNIRETKPSKGGEMRKEDELMSVCSASSCSANTIVDDHEIETTVSSGEPSIKRYRNSPFGLNRHYLTMPDSVYRHQQHSAKLFNGIGVGVHPHLGDLDEQNQDPLDKFSDLDSENDYHHRQRGAAIVTQPHHATGRRHESGSKQSMAILGQLQPAGDAGLDAKKCFAKDVESCASAASRGDHFYARHSKGASTKELEARAKVMNYHQADSRLVGADLGGHQFVPANKLIHEHKVHAKRARANAPDSGSLLVRFSSIMYATFLVILGCILHVSELRQKSRNSSDHIYTTIVALVGILWLLFLQTDIQRYKRYASKYILIETIFNDHKQRRREELASNVDPSARSTTSSSASLVNDRMSMNTEVIFKKTAYKMYQRAAALDRHQARQYRKSSLEPLAAAGTATPTLNKTQTTAASSEDLTSLGGEYLVPAYKFLHGKMGANFYLKCGMAAFCFGHVIHEGLRFGQQLYFFGSGNLHCRDSAALVAHLVTPLYSFYQLFMMFKYSNLVINRHKILARFGLMHIIGTSITFWFRTILEEAFEDFVHKMDYFKTNKPHMSQNHLALTKLNESDSNLTSLLNSISNAIKIEASERSEWSITNPASDQPAAGSMFGQPASANLTQSLLALMSSPISATITPQLARHLPDSYACAQNTLLTTKSMNALPYLYPFTIEYNLLLAATFLSLYFNIGKIGCPEGGGATCSPFKTSHQRSNKYRNNHNSPIHSKRQRSFNSGSLGSHVESSDNSSAIRMRDNNSSLSGGSSREKELQGEYKSNFVVNADCHSANKGLFCGFFILLVTLVTIVIFFVTINKPTHIQLGIKINLIQEATLTALILIVTLAGFKQVVKLNRNPHLKDKVTTDDVLMLIPLPFFFIHSLLSFRAETASFSSVIGGVGSNSIGFGNLGNNFAATVLGGSGRNNISNIVVVASGGNSTGGTNSLTGGGSSRSGNNGNSNSNFSISSSSSTTSTSPQIDHFKLITVALNIIVMIEVLVQTNFIIDGMRRCSESRYLRFKKPGRELITFAILLNLTYWIVATFETKSVEQYKTEIEYYGPLPYMFISHTTLPVMLFYRYHSSVCLAEIWNRAYKPPKKR